MTSTVTIRLEESVKNKLEKLADATQRSRSFLAAEAIRDYVETHEWQINEIQAAIQEANVGDFATEDEVQTLLDKWKAK
ncbi:MAG: CopG family ribbon-helix-helix protein [Methylococcales bacterium]